VIGNDIPDSLQALLEKQQGGAYSKSPSLNKQTQQAHTLQARQQSRADESMVRSPAFVEATESELHLENSQAANLAPPPSVLEPDQMDSIRAELEAIKNVLKFQVSELADERKKRNNPTHHYLQEQLLGMGIGPQLARQFVDFLPHNVDEKQGWKYLLNLLSNRLHVGGNDILTQSGVVALVGPTGTGKTTTLAKLAAKYAQKYGADQVAMVTIDTYRIAAFEQLATYGRIIGCSVKKAQNAEELNQILSQMRNKKLVLIDTAGFSQRDARLIEQLNDYQAGLSIKIRKYLVLPAGAQNQVLNQ
jgi:flagellar biosynthesis protein FlhF